MEFAPACRFEQMCLTFLEEEGIRPDAPALTMATQTHRHQIVRVGTLVADAGQRGTAEFIDAQVGVAFGGVVPFSVGVTSDWVGAAAIIPSRFDDSRFERSISC